MQNFVRIGKKIHINIYYIFIFLVGTAYLKGTRAAPILNPALLIINFLINLVDDLSLNKTLVK